LRLELEVTLEDRRLTLYQFGVICRKSVNPRAGGSAVMLSTQGAIARAQAEGSDKVRSGRYAQNTYAQTK
jgi:hypothetical protein